MLSFLHLCYEITEYRGGPMVYIGIAPHDYYASKDV